MTRFELRLIDALIDNDCDAADRALAIQCKRCMFRNTTPCTGRCWYEEQHDRVIVTIIERTPVYKDEE